MGGRASGGCNPVRSAVEGMEGCVVGCVVVLLRPDDDDDDEGVVGKRRCP